MEVNKIHNEDCLDTMSRMDDKSVDLTLTDFPYGKNLKYDVFNDSTENVRQLVKKVMPEILRVSKFVLLTCGTDRTHYYPEPDDMFCIYQPANASFSAYGHITWQPILVYGKDPHTSLKKKWMSIQNTELTQQNGHPCPKPQKLWNRCLMRGSAKESDIIYDPFMGSGTTAIACIKTDRHYIGSEISEEYCKIAEKRIQQELSQLKLSL